MASRTIFDPTTLLRITPLLAATCTLWANIDHALFLDFTPAPPSRPSLNRSASELTPCTAHTPTSPLAALFSLYEANTTALAAVAGAALNLISSQSSSPLSSPSTSSALFSVVTSPLAALRQRPAAALLLSGLAFTAAHLAVQPYLSRVVRALAQAQTDGARRVAAGRWKKALLARAIVLDLPAWACFLGAAMASLRPIAL